MDEGKIERDGGRYTIKIEFFQHDYISEKQKAKGWKGLGVPGYIYQDEKDF